MKIQNSKTEVPNNVNLNDKDYLDRLLCKLKELVKGYATVITEASNDQLVKDYKKNLEIFSALQRETFELMFQNGWYILETAEDKKINSELQMLEKEFSSLAEGE